MANDFVTKLQEPLNIAGIAVAVGCAVVGLVFRKKTVGIGLLFASVTAIAFTLAHSLTPAIETVGTPKTSGAAMRRYEKPMQMQAPLKQIFPEKRAAAGGLPFGTRGMDIPAITGVITSEIYQ